MESFSCEEWNFLVSTILSAWTELVQNVEKRLFYKVFECFEIQIVGKPLFEGFGIQNVEKPLGFLNVFEGFGIQIVENICFYKVFEGFGV